MPSLVPARRAALVAGAIQFTSNVATRYVVRAAGRARRRHGESGRTGADRRAERDGRRHAESRRLVRRDERRACGHLSDRRRRCRRVRRASSFPYQVKNAQSSLSDSATATVIFLPASNLTVNVKDAPTGLAITDYRWIIEEDRTFWVDPKCQINSTDPLVRPVDLPAAAGREPRLQFPYRQHAGRRHRLRRHRFLRGRPAGSGQPPPSATSATASAAPMRRRRTPARPGRCPSRSDQALLHLDPAGRRHQPDHRRLRRPGARICGTYNRDRFDTGFCTTRPTGSAGNCGHAMGGAQTRAGPDRAPTSTCSRPRCRRRRSRCSSSRTTTR